MPAIYERDLQRLRSTTPPAPKTVFGNMFGGKAPETNAPTANVALEPEVQASETPASEELDHEAANSIETTEEMQTTGEIDVLRSQLELAKTELEKQSQPLWVRLRTIQHEHEQAVFDARLAKGQINDAKTRLQHSEQTITVLRRDLAKALEISEFERRKRLESEETQRRLVKACERFEQVN